ncbi:hypothetical protein ILYODFUR_012148 [Ilyodon furcidens]|uniref:Uncharacterized protein n=1 Tax=Ilyodon furcidens TaxID=33524 RepID=A0ABV0TLZ7_9TELE
MKTLQSKGGAQRASLVCPASAERLSFFSRAAEAHSTGADNSRPGSPLICLGNRGQLGTSQEMGHACIAAKNSF